MNSILLPPAQERSTGRIVVIESDPVRARALRHALRQHVNIDLEIVSSTDAAIASIRERLPDLVMTSTFLPPADAAKLASHVRQMPEASHLQIITVPYFIDADDDALTDASGTRVLSFLRRRRDLDRPRCDLKTLREQIEDYLDQAVAFRPEAGSRIANGLEPRPETPVWLAPADAASSAAYARARSDRRRARRRAGGEVPTIWSVKLPWTTQVSIVDISSRGVLLETTSKITPGSMVDLQLLGQDTNLSIASRMVRSEVAGVDAFGVRYRVAAAFSRDLELIGLQPPAAAALAPKTLAEVLTRVLGELDRTTGQGAARVRFEYELRRLLPLRDIQIRRAPVVADEGTDSIYFTVPHGSGSRPILQAIFEPGYEPSAGEFRLLRAAASLAAVVLEYAPLPEEPGVPRVAGQSSSPRPIGRHLSRCDARQ